jgi:hypothetical protein
MNSAYGRWKWALLPALLVSFIAIYPQLNFWAARGQNWHGSYVLTQSDEVAYSGYINALIAGRPRRTDPFNGIEDKPGAPQHESLFSIQFIPAYIIALPARMLGASASTAFIWLIFLGGLASSLAVFLLLLEITKDPRWSAVGVLIILFFGAMVAAQGEARLMLTGQRVHDMFSFLRRYQPSVVFPLFFVFAAMVWRALTAEKSRTSYGWALGAGILFAVVVFSYFFFWTAMGAWLVALTVFCFALHPVNWRRYLTVFGIIGACAVASIIPFTFMLANRNPSMDTTQQLEYSHAPSLTYPPEIFGIVILVVAYIVLRKRLSDFAQPTIAFAMSLLAMPIVIFNQQVISGRLLQPIHYKVFIANYAVLTGFVIILPMIARGTKAGATQFSARALFLIGALAFAWGLVEVAGIAKRDIEYTKIRDEATPALKRIDEITRQDGLYDRIKSGTATYPIVYASNLMMAADVPTETQAAVLWAMHTPAAGMSLDESKKRFYYYLYFSGTDEKELAQAMLEGRFIVLSTLFGVERVIPGISLEQKQISQDEMRVEIRRYAEFVRDFGAEQAVKLPLSFAVAPSAAEPNYTNLDRWYERVTSENCGIYKLYRLKPKF